MRILGISGSVSTQSRTAAVIQLALGSAAALLGVDAGFLGLADRQLEFCDGRPVDAYNMETQEAIRAVLAADALIVGTPMYRGTYTGALKNLMDLVPREPMAGKVVALVATGGSLHHYLALEHGLRPLFGFFQCLTVPDTVYVTPADFTADGELSASAREAVQHLAATVVALTTATKGIGLRTVPPS